MFTIIKEAFSLLGNFLGLALAKALKPFLEDLPGIGDTLRENMEANMRSVESSISNSTNMIKNIIKDGDIIGDFERAAKAFPETFDREYNKANPGGKIEELAAKMRKLEIASNAAADAAARINIEDDITIKIGKERISNADRIKELTLDIVEAKALGNVEQAAELEASKAYYEQLERSLKKNKTLQEAITDATKAREAVIDGVLDKNKKVTKELKEQLALSVQIAAKIAAAEAKDKVDKGGRLEKRALDALAKGDFRGAERARKRLAGNEDDAAIQEAFGGEGKFGKNIKDIAKEQGIDTFRKTSKELREELAKLAKKRQDELAPGAGGKDKEAAKGKPVPPKDPMVALSDLVKDIKNLVAKIEPKLPQHALI